MAWIDVPQAPGAARARARARDAARPGYEIRNAASPDEAELLIYDEIDSWWGVSAGDVISALAGITAPNLRVRVNSPGGSVFEGLAIANALRAHPSDVTVQVDGLAASIASVIALAGNRLVMMPNSMLMIHEASGLCIGDATDMQQMAGVLGKISDNIAGAYAAKAGGTPEQWRETMRAETWYLPEDAVAAGLADEAIDAQPATDPAEPDMHARWDLTVYGYQGPKAPEKPKPGPPPVQAAAVEPEPAPPTLTISLGDALDEKLVAALRAAVRDHGAEVAAAEAGGTVTPIVPAEPVGTGQGGTAAGQEPPPAPEPAAPATELHGEHGPEIELPEAAEPETAPDPEPEVVASAEPTWASVMAQLTQPRPDPWAAAINRLLTQVSSSSATES
ncbi:head maturation protease, ClpP-related [Actinacidiphila sp. ITFR-21]|uniref:head maturation protease, ClpP-related n=1 Tax=Actinacidiphila sp. ITFR-21 TaxID=3075199 RepID=UPI00288AE4B5|nr:head maturation protease, ClpP-related [Streptomyces sp. ITFR-21]WNI19164.1 Clp protease ClpP [Streptomyces sp. ITFR-21]